VAEWDTRVHPWVENPGLLPTLRCRRKGVSMRLVHIRATDDRDVACLMRELAVHGTAGYALGAGGATAQECARSRICVMRSPSVWRSGAAADRRD
jgi:hypothetical protein